MSKKLLVMIAVIMAIICVLSFTACKEEEEPQDVKFTVTFDLNYEGASEPFLVTVNENAVVPTQTAPVRNGYNFGGWYTDKTCTTEFTFDAVGSTAVIVKDITLYAKWTAKDIIDSTPILSTIVAFYNGENIFVGEDLDVADIVVTATYTDTSKKTVTDFTISGFDSETAGVKTVTVTYTEKGATRTATVNVTVVEKVVLASINAVYGGGDIIVGKTLNVADIVVIATYSDETTKAITDFSISGFDSATVGAKTVTVSYTEGEITKTDDVVITVKECEHTGGKATCKTKAVCTECGESYGELDLDNHEGTAEWTITETTHAQSYTCCSLVVVAEGNHEGGTATCTTKAECTVCEERYGELDADNHEGTAEWTITETTHAQSYICCHAVVVAEGNHEYDNACDADCNACGYVREVGDHAYDNACDTDCNHCGEIREVGDHVYDNACDTTCNECGDVREVEGHVYDNTCDVDCNVCGEIREVGDHVYSSDCDTTCNECGNIREAGDHTYDGACDTECNECGNIREAGEHTYDDVCDASCNVCGTDREAPHSYVSDCDEVCDLCEATREVEADHTYEDGACKDCGAVEPAPVVTGIQASLIEDDTVYFVDTEVNDTVDSVLSVYFVIEEVYSNDSHVEIATEAYDEVDITIKSGNEAVAGPCVYTLSYNGFTCDVEVTLVRKLAMIGIITDSGFVSYNSDLVVIAMFYGMGDDYEEDVSASDKLTITGYNKTDVENTQSVTATYTENGITETDTVEIMVLNENNGIYAIYEGTLDHNASIEDIIVEDTILAEYVLDNGDHGAVIDSADVTVIAVNASTIGENGSVTIQVGEFTYEITGITVVRTFVDYNVAYNGGELETGVAIDLANVSVTANYSDGSTEDVEEGITLGEYDKTTTGIKEIEVIVNEEVVGTIKVEYVAYNTLYYYNENGWDSVYAYAWSTEFAPTAPTSSDFVIKGVNGDWATGLKMDRMENVETGWRYVKLTVNGTDGIKVNKGDIWSGNVVNSSGVSYTHDGKGNLVLAAGTYTIDYYSDSNNMIIKKYEESDGEQTGTVVTKVLGDWPGTAMTAIGNGWYSIKVEEQVDKIVFNNGLSGTSEKKTADLTIDLAKPYYNNGVWESHIHTYSADCDTTCNYEGCEVTRTASESHSYPNDCTATTCTVCNEVTKVAGEHTGGEATCKTLAVCTVCGLSYGEFNEDNHEGDAEWTITETTHAQKYTCCEAVKVAEGNHEGGTATCIAKAVCIVCETAYGDFADHTYDANVWESDDNQHWHVCTVCEEEVTDTKAAHEYEDGTCVCGKEEPETITTVGIQATLKNDRVYFVDTEDNDTVDAISASDLVISEVLSNESTALIPQSAYENVTITILSGNEAVAGACTYVVRYNDFTYNVEVTLVRKLKAVSDDNVFDYDGNVAYGSTTINIQRVLVTYYGVEGPFDVTNQVVVGDFNPTYVMGEQLVNVTYTENGIIAPWQISIMVIDSKRLTVTQKENVDALVLNHEQTSVDVSEILAIYDVKFVYESGREEVVTTDITVTVSAVECGNNGSITITVDGQSVTIEGLTVVRVLKEITVEYTGDVEIDINKEINTDDITVTAIYSNNDKEAITDYELSDYDYTTVGTKTISVLVGGDKVGEFTVEYVSYTTYYFNNVDGWEEVYVHSWGVTETPIAPKAGDYVIVGSFNGWEDSIANGSAVVLCYSKEDGDGNTEYYFEGLALPANAELKIAKVGSNGTTAEWAEVNLESTLATGGGSSNVIISGAGNYVFYYTPATGKLYVGATNSGAKEPNVKLTTVFDGTTWHGVQMTAVEGQDGWYSIKVDARANRIIFNNGLNDASEKKTEDLTIDAAKPYYNNGVWEDHIHIYSADCDTTCNYEGCEVTRTASESHSYPNDCTATTCTVCNEVTKVAGDHVYDNESDVDCNACGAVREIEACVHEMTHYEAVAATCTATGNVEYWACSVCGKNYDAEQDGNVILDVTIAIDEEAHTQEAVWAKDADSHRHYYPCCDADIVADTDHTWTNGVCSVVGCGYVCEHNTEEYVSYENGTHGAICTICTEILIESEACSYTHEYVSVNETIHYAGCICGDFKEEEHVDEDANNVCDKCEQELEVACEHTDVKYVCNDNGTHNEVCNDCSYIIQENVTCAYTHEYVSVNDTIHYAGCICGDLKEEEHVYDNACDTTCNAVGCEYEREITHDYTKLQTSETEHWYVCSVCDEEQPESRASHSGGTATCIAKAVCTVCETAYGDFADHTYDANVWEKDENEHWHVCTVDGCEVTDTKAAHEYVEGTCVCGATESTEPETVEVEFTFGENGDPSHSDGSTASEYTETNGDYTLTLTNLSKVYKNARDAKGNSALKLGTSSDVGSFSFTVPSDITKVIINAAGYKANTAKVQINSGDTITVSELSNNGEYKAIEVDTTTNKTISFTTVSGGVRCMINSIVFVKAGSGSEEPECEHTGGTANCQEKAVCTLCGQEYGDYGDHIYGEDWKSDDNQHWHECTVEGCGATDTKVNHEYVDGICECGKEESTDPEDPEDPSTPQDFELSFVDVANRTSYSTTQQVWEQNGVTVTNDKASSSNNVADYSNPVRLYASSTLTVEYASMTKIVFKCSESKYVTPLVNSITSGGTVTSDGNAVTVVLDSTVDSFTLTLGAQVRLSSIVVTALVGGGEVECEHTGGTATCTTKAVCSICGESYGELNADNHEGTAEWTITETTHMQKYTCCEAVEVAEGNHEGGTATCTSKKECTVCGGKYGEVDASVHTGEAEWTYTDTTHTKTYSCCGHVVVDGEEHVYVDGTCVCGKAEPASEECEHTGGTATCTSKAVCDLCGEEYGEVNAEAHNWNAGVVTTPATCSATGTMTYTCTHNAEHTKTEEIAINADAHSWNEGVVTTDPTCTTEGVKTFTCVYNESHTYTDTVAKLAHTMTHYEAVAATCTAAGNVEYWACSVCGKNYDAEQDGDVLESVIVAIDEEAHTQDAIWAKDADSHRHYYPCCGADIVGDTAHTWTNGVCSVVGCGYVCEHDTGYVSYEDGTHGAICTICNEILIESEACSYTHEYVSEDETIHYAGCICGDAIEEEHVDEDANNVCDKCEQELAVVPEGVTITFEFGENGTASHSDGSDLGTSASYEADGYTLSITDASKVYKNARDAQGNSALKLGTGSVAGSFTFTVPNDITKVIINAAKYKKNAATVAVNGNSTALTKNSDDGEYDEIEIDTTTNKTITFAVTSGYRCMINSIVFVKEGSGSEEPEEHEHDYTKLQTSETEHWYVCSVCDVEKPESRASHSGGTANCQEKAVCNLCHQEYGNYGDHIYGEDWKSDGTQHWHECTVEGCGATDTKVNHEYVDGICECGKEESTDPEDPEDPVVPSAPITASKTMTELITEYGWTSSTTKQTFKLDDVVTVKVNGGSNSGKAYNGDHIRIYATDSPAGSLTIDLAEGYELVSVNVTTKTGTYAFLCVGEDTTTDISNVSTTVSGTSVVLNSVKNGTDGKQVQVTAMEVVYKATGGGEVECEHTGGTATCTSKAVCDLCGEEYGEVNAEAHNWNAGVVTTPATCSATGTMTYTCTHNAEHTKTEDVAIDENAHSWNEGVVTTDPTCTTKGVKTYTCTHNAEHTKTEDVAIDKNAHTQDAIWAKDADSHRHYYPCCGADIVADTAHTWENGVCSVEGCEYACEHTGGEATCIAKAECNICGIAYGNFADHTYDANVWESDDNQHWHVCTVCEEEVTDTKAAHEYEDGTCACGKAEPVEITLASIEAKVNESIIFVGTEITASKFDIVKVMSDETKIDLPEAEYANVTVALKNSEDDTDVAGTYVYVVTYQEKSVEVEVTFTRELGEIVVEPTELELFYNTEITIADISSVKAHYYGTEEVIDVTSSENVKIGEYDKTKVDAIQTVVITYTENGVSVTDTILVLFVMPSITGIDVKQKDPNEALVLKHGQETVAVDDVLALYDVVYVYDNDDEVAVEAENITTEAIADLEMGADTGWVSITVGEYSYDLEGLTVVDVLVSISATYGGGEVDVNAPLDESKVTVKATYSYAGETAVSEGYELSGFSSATEGVKTVTVTYQGKTSTFNVTVNDIVDIYFYNYANWTTVSAYAWYNNGTTDVTNAGWPGVVMKRDGTSKWWFTTVDADVKYTSIIFNNGNNGDQTGNLTLDLSKPYFALGAWYASKPTSSEITNNTVIVKDNAGWSSDSAIISVHAWSSSTSNTYQTTKIANNIYAVKIGITFTGMLVARISPTDNSWWNQTKDITDITKRLVTITGWNNDSFTQAVITVA